MNQFKFRLSVLLMNDSDTFYSRPNAQFWVLSKNNFVQETGRRLFTVYYHNSDNDFVAKFRPLSLSLSLYLFLLLFPNVMSKQIPRLLHRLMSLQMGKGFLCCHQPTTTTPTPTSSNSSNGKKESEPRGSMRMSEA